MFLKCNFICYSEEPSKIGVRVGSSITNKGGVIHAIEKIIVHAGFNKGVELDNDIALIKVRFLMDK